VKQHLTQGDKQLLIAGLDVERLAAVLRRVEALDMQDIALEITASGVKVVPTVPGKKDPMLETEHIKGCAACRRDGLHAMADQGATLDPDEIRRYWRIHTDAGVGMKEHPRLLRGDGDHADSDARKASRKALGYGTEEPLPFGAPTPGGMYRLRYLHLQPDGQTLGGGGTKAFDVSWYGTGGYVLVAGLHPNGFTYRNFYGEHGITPAPAALVAVLQQCANGDGPPGVTAASTKAVQAFLAAHRGTQNMALLQRRRKIVADARNGERHHTALAQLTIGFKDAVIGLVPAASVRDVVRDGLAAAGWGTERFDKEFDDLVSWAVAQVDRLDPEAIRTDRKTRLDQALTKDREPQEDDSYRAARDLTEHELDAIEAEQRGGVRQTNRDDPYENVPSPGDEDAPNAQQSDPDRYRRWTVDELLAADLTFHWDITGMLVRPTYGQDAGELKTLKSVIGQSRQIALAGGVPMLGYWDIPQRRRVLAYVAEGGRIPWTRRYHRLCQAHGVDPRDLNDWIWPIFDSGPLDDATFRTTLRAHLTDLQPAFVHLDPLYPFQPMSVDSNRLSHVGAMLSEVQRICAEHDATLWFTTHMNQTGNGFDLKRITGAGIGEWGDSWTLIKHRQDPDVAGGRFHLAVEIGSRQWGGAAYDVDIDLGRFDPDEGTHDGAIKFNIRTAAGPENVDKDAALRVKARAAVMKTLKAARTPLTRTEIKDRSTGASKAHIIAEIDTMIDQELLVAHGIRKPDKGGREAPLYMLVEEWRNA
jgi:hypothetical protein